jgi:ACR3 family arsenite efflux pump ArsB
MNTAQKRNWVTFVTSIITILVAAAITTFVYIKQVEVLNISKPTIIRLFGLICAIPLILLVITSWLFPKKDFDERDKHIDRKAAVYGGIGALIALCVAAQFLVLTSRAGPIKSLQLPYVAYLVCFIYYLVYSIAALIQYDRGNKGGKTNE